MAMQRALTEEKAAKVLGPGFDPARHQGGKVLPLDRWDLAVVLLHSGPEYVRATWERFDEMNRANQQLALAGIRTARQAAGLRQHQLARRLEVDRATLSRWETGAIVPGKTQRRRLVEVLMALEEELVRYLEALDIPNPTHPVVVKRAEALREAGAATIPPDDVETSAWVIAQVEKLAFAAATGEKVGRGRVDPAKHALNFLALYKVPSHVAQEAWRLAVAEAERVLAAGEVDGEDDGPGDVHDLGGGMFFFKSPPGRLN